MSEIYKLVQAIESYNESDLCLGTLRSLKKIKDAAAMLEAELADKKKLIKQMKTVFAEMLEKPRVEVWAWENKIKELLEESNG